MFAVIAMYNELDWPKIVNYKIYMELPNSEPTPATKKTLVRVTLG